MLGEGESKNPLRTFALTLRNSVKKLLHKVAQRITEYSMT